MKFKIIANEQTPRTTEKVDLSNDFKMLDKFLSFARRQYNCVGLASNQVSLKGVRINKSFFALLDNNFWDIYINPEIVKYIGKKEEKIEGCLTWLGKDIIADRYPEIVVEYQKLNGEFKAETISGFKAQIFQHEYNHLMGIAEKVRDRKKISERYSKRKEN